MKVNLLGSFAAGILIATTISGAVYLTDKSEVTKTSVKQVKVLPSETEMKEKLAAAGYVVETKADYDKKLKAASTVATSKAPAPAANKTVVTRVIVNVSDGMTSIDVGRVLESAKIIPNAFNFSKDVEKKGLQNKLRPGTFVVDSGMAYDQVIATIFK